MNENDIRVCFANVVKMHLQQTERILSLEAKVNALQLILTRVTGSTVKELFEEVHRLECGFRAEEPGREKTDQLRAEIELFIAGKNQQGYGPCLPPIETAMGGAARFVVGSPEKSEEWASSPHQRPSPDDCVSHPFGC
jgi:hypothetical protein